MPTPQTVVRATTAPNGVVYTPAVKRVEDVPAWLADARRVKIPVDSFVKLEFVTVDQDTNLDLSEPVPLDPKTGAVLPAAKPEGK